MNFEYDKLHRTVKYRARLILSVSNSLDLPTAWNAVSELTILNLSGLA